MQQIQFTNPTADDLEVFAPQGILKVQVGDSVPLHSAQSVFSGTAAQLSDVIAPVSWRGAGDRGAPAAAAVAATAC